WSTTSTVGHFGDASIPVADRILAAQTHVLAAALLALVLAALFADRRRSEAALTESHDRLRKSEQGFREMLGVLPAAIYTTDAAGRITYCNEGAVNLWGLRPKLGEDKWCDLGRLYYPDGKRMEIRDCPTEIALNQGRCVRGTETVLERMDGTRIPMIPN